MPHSGLLTDPKTKNKLKVDLNQLRVTIMYAIEFTPNARRQLKKAPKDMAVRILAALKQLAEAPYQNTNVKKLVGSDFYRLRVANWRVIYDIYDDKLVITVLEMGHRKEVYR